MKNKFKINKLFLYAILNLNKLLFFVNSSIERLNNLEMYKFLINFIIFLSKTMKKSFSCVFFFYLFYGNQTYLNETKC